MTNCLKKVETSVVLIIFNCVISHFRAYTVTVSFCRSTRIRYQNQVHDYNNTKLYFTPFISTQRLFRIIFIPSKFCYFRPADHVISMKCSALNFWCQCTQQKLQWICAVLTFDHQLKKILTFSVKDRYQLNHFICIKDFNTETITSLKLNLFSLFICGSQHHQRKTICLYVYISDIRQIVGYRTPVFIQPFPWCLHITITYIVPHL